MSTGPNDNKNFLDSNTILAIVLTLVFWFAWSYFMKPAEQAQAPQATAQGNAQATQSGTQANTAAGAQAPAQAELSAAQPTSTTPETFTDYTSSQMSFQISSRGMGLKNIDVRAFKTRDDKPIILGSVTERYPFSTSLVATDQPIDFTITKAGENVFKGTAQVGGMNIEKTLTIDSNRYLVTSETKVTGAGADFKGLSTYLSDVLFDDPPSAGLFNARAETQDFYFSHDGTDKHNTLKKSTGLNVAEKNVNLLALSSHYFTLAAINRSDLLPRLEAKIEGNAATATARLIHQPVNPTTDFTVKIEGYAGPKQLAVLESIDKHLGDIIQYGMFSWIAKPLLSVLKFFHGLVSNWGVAIILLTLLVRLIVLPINLYSIRSMKAMQKIQPEMQRLKEKYKSDPVVMNREVMALMKRSGANPVGGCLPMLLQMPAFFALYAVLGQSIELYRSPFILWIHDLSMKDPFFVMPVLMGATMFVQQKLTPSNMDPAQQKVMQFMPILFTLFMVTLPSGLTLYIFVSTLSSIAQQWFVMRDKSPDAKVSQARA